MVRQELLQAALQELLQAALQELLQAALQQVLHEPDFLQAWSWGV
jgi:hypothetical protein